MNNQFEQLSACAFDELKSHGYDSHLHWWIDIVSGKRYDRWVKFGAHGWKEVFEFLIAASQVLDENKC
jgi:hypothetical protein